jgi:AhpD family alkylhydroperoxidase
MRLSILDEGHGFGTKIVFALIRALSGHPVLDVIKLVKYRPDFYGSPMGAVTQEAMRGPSAWSVGDRELMAAVVARSNGSEWCTKAHSAVARGAYRDEAKVRAALEDGETASIAEPLAATLRMLRKLTRERSVSADDVRAVFAAGASREQIEDALAVCFAFSVIGRLADAFGFLDPGPEAFEAGAKYLLARGYR